MAANPNSVGTHPTPSNRVQGDAARSGPQGSGGQDKRPEYLKRAQAEWTRGDIELLLTGSSIGMHVYSHAQRGSPAAKERFQKVVDETFERVVNHKPVTPTMCSFEETFDQPSDQLINQSSDLTAPFEGPYFTNFQASPSVFDNMMFFQAQPFVVDSNLDASLNVSLTNSSANSSLLDVSGDTSFVLNNFNDDPLNELINFESQDISQ